MKQTKQVHAPMITLEEMIFGLPIWHKSAQDLESLCEELSIKQGFEPTQEELAKKCFDKIVTSLNCHEELLGLLKQVQAERDNLSEDFWNRLDRAIAKAEGK